MAQRAVNLALYRAMWRWTLSKPMRHARFAVPLDPLPATVLAVAERLPPPELRDQAGVQRLIRAAWRADRRAETAVASDGNNNVDSGARRAA